MSQLPQRNQGRWTLIDGDGNAAVEFTSFLSLDLRAASKVVTGPVEEGSFVSYNKVEAPLEIDVSLGIQGTDAELQAALDRLDDLQATTELINLVTPDSEYQFLNLEEHSYRRKREEGLGVLWVDLSFVEVRQVTPQYASAGTGGERLGKRQQRGKQQPVQKQESAAHGLFGKVRCSG